MSTRSCISLYDWVGRYKQEEGGVVKKMRIDFWDVSDVECTWLKIYDDGIANQKPKEIQIENDEARWFRRDGSLCIGKYSIQNTGPRITWTRDDIHFYRGTLDTFVVRGTMIWKKL